MKKSLKLGPVNALVKLLDELSGAVGEHEREIRK
jgi:hypothetical protein